jgi:cytochrome c oxidase subunit 2
VGKWWSVLFGVVMTAAAVLFIVAPFVPGWWLPRRVSAHAWDVDRLFYIILAITGFFFILTEALLVVFMWRFAHQPGQRPHVFGHHAMQEKGALWTSFFKRTFRPVSALLHDQHRVELAWTLVPAAILLYIAFAQVNTWADVKYRSRMPAIDTPGGRVALQVEVSARQFEWRMRYPSPERWQSWKEDPARARDFATNPHQDDVHVVNELHVWTDSAAADAESEETDDFPAFVVQLRTLDILHSFNIPTMRVKQDSLPGKVLPVWFRPTRYNTALNKKTGQWEDGYDPSAGGGDKFGHPGAVWEIPCAELCGRDHSRMIGRVYVHRSEKDFLDWLGAEAARQESTRRETKVAAITR